MPSELNPPQLAALTAAKRLARSIRDVRGVDYGFAYVEGKITDQASIRFHTEQKKPLMDLQPNQRLPDMIEGVEIDVLTSSYMLHDGTSHTVQEILQPGLSIGNVRTKTTGTLGAFVRDLGTEEISILSNWHVLCGGPEAAVGDDICQPGPFDLGSNAARPVARLERWLRLSETYDAALARLLSGIQSSQRLFGTASQPSGISGPVLGQRVMKSGAVSGLTHAIIDGISGSYRLDYTNYGDSTEWMSGFRLIQDPNLPSKALSIDGDSGSLWVDSEGEKAIGLHFAGEDEMSLLNEYALAHPIQDLCERLNVTLAVPG